MPRSPPPSSRQKNKFLRQITRDTKMCGNIPVHIYVYEYQKKLQQRETTNILHYVRCTPSVHVKNRIFSAVSILHTNLCPV